MKRFLWFIVLSLVITFVTGCNKTKEAENVVSPRALQVGEYTFEDGIRGWNPIGKEVVVSQSTEKFHDGKASLKISGTGKAGLWSLMRSERISLTPDKHYSFRGWMLIDSISSNTSFFKFELTQEGKWLKNIDSTQYDPKKKSTWQELTGDFVAPAGKDIAVSITVEKRPMDKDVSAVIYVDSLKLERTD